MGRGPSTPPLQEAPGRAKTADSGGTGRRPGGRSGRPRSNAARAKAGGGVGLKESGEGGKVKVRIGHAPAFDLLARSSHPFFVAAVDATLEFSQGESAAQTVTLHQGADVIELKRKP